MWIYLFSFVDIKCEKVLFPFYFYFYIFNRCFARKTVRVRVSLLQKEYIDISHILPDFRKHCIKIRKSRKIKHLLPFASAEDGVTVNQSSKACTSTEIEEMRMKLDLSLQSEDNSSGLLQSIHDAARLFELGIKQQGSLSSMSWFSTAWLGVDNTAWVKVLSYQVGHCYLTGILVILLFLTCVVGCFLTSIQ